MLEVLRLWGVVQIVHNAHAAVPAVRRFLLALPAGGCLRRHLAVIVILKLADQRNLNLVLAPLRAVIVVRILNFLLG